MIYGTLEKAMEYDKQGKIDEWLQLFLRNDGREAGIEESQFRKIWDKTDDDRSIGKMTFEDAVKLILEENNCYSDELFHTMIQKRTISRDECFQHLHKEILPMLQALKSKGAKIGLISNCFSEEVVSIRKSILFPYFDAVCLSFEEEVMKPDERIYESCMNKLQVKADECLYVGDGGSKELETALKMGMSAAQAVWYIKDGINQPYVIKEGFSQLMSPMEVLEYI